MLAERSRRTPLQVHHPDSSHQNFQRAHPDSPGLGPPLPSEYLGLGNVQSAASQHQVSAHTFSSEELEVLVCCSLTEAADAEVSLLFSKTV